MLYLDRPSAEQVIKDVTAKIGDMETTAQEIHRLIVDQLPQYWKGVAADKAESTYLEEYKDFLQRRVPEMVGSLRDYMQECVKQISDVDSQLAGK